MKNKIFLSSMLIMSVAPAMAETFPSNGYMQENKTYDNAATSTNMDGVYSGTVNATAEYDIINYIVNAGQYLPADSETVITCPAGSFCPGISGNVQYNQTTPQGIQTCPTGYASSIAGASSDTECYRQCSGNVTIAHATAVTGNDYYGAGVDTCAPTACENGYHVDSGSLDLTSLIDEDGNGYTENHADGSESYSYHMSNTIIANDPMAFAVDYGTKGIIKGHGRCSTRSSTDPWVYDEESEEDTYELQNDNITSTLPDSAGQYCYCQLDGYIPSGGTMQSLSAPWVFYSEYTEDEEGEENWSDGPDNCAIHCTGSCSAFFLNGGGGRAAVFSTVTGGGSGNATCEANTITINWSNADANDISANNAGTVTYGSDVRTPVKAQTIKGKTFRGWRFSAPEQTTTGGN